MRRLRVRLKPSAVLTEVTARTLPDREKFLGGVTGAHCEPDQSGCIESCRSLSSGKIGLKTLA
jgi:hypothetical protein